MRKEKINGIIGLIEGGAAVLTVNSRLSRYLSAEYDSAMKERGRAFWPTPLILPFSSWVDSLWTEAGQEAALLGAMRSKALWDHIVSNDAASKNILMPKGAFDDSFKAYSIMKEYNLKLPEDALYLTEEAQAFKRWAFSYEAEVKRLGFVERHTLTDRLPGLIRSGHVALPSHMVLAGFDELTPKTSEFISALERLGVNSSRWPSEPGVLPDITEAAGRVTVRPYADELEEVEQAARWARKTARPGVRIGFIVPELNRYRDIIRREFSHELDPASVFAWDGRRKLFNISLGAPLSEEPLVRSALQIISVGEGKVELEDISPILHSPFLSENRLILTRIDAGLKKDNCLTVSLNDLKKRSARYSKGLEEKLGLWMRSLRGSPSRQLPSLWARSFSALLKDLGWLSGLSLTSDEFQTLKAWNALLEAFSSLDEITGKVSRKEAATKLAALASDRIHQGETPECGVEVVGLLEAAGQYFDHVWLMGCHEFALPAPPAPNPFIPAYIQREGNVPHSSYERELSFARSLLAGVLRSAPSIEVSYPMRTGEKDAFLSPLLRPLGSTLDGSVSNATSRLKDASHSLYSLEDLSDDPWVPVTEAEAASITGGTLIIKDQSLCPFKAFATHRLHAAPVASPEPGMSEADRGSILHLALKVFWERTVDSNRLKGIIEREELDGYVKVLSDEVFSGAGISEAVSARVIELEKERLERLFREWALLEVQRGAFRVKHVELEEKITIGGLTIKGRIDRVDETDGGEEVIIDYKSGKPDKNDWLTSRPSEPQLLVYSLSGRFDAVSFARLVPGDCRFIGISRADGVLPSVRSLDKDAKFREKAENRGWDELMEFWKATIETLAGDFLSGRAQVDPNPELKGRKSPCVYCELTTLCRVSDALTVNPEEDSGDE